MRTLSLMVVAVWMAGGVARGAVPATTDFDGNYFRTNALPVTIVGNLTNWQNVAATSAGAQGLLGQVYQATNANLTSWAAVAPSAKQDALGYTAANSNNIPQCSLYDVTRAPFNVACWGDSLTGGTGGTPYPTQLSLLLLTNNVVNFGHGGQKSSSVLTNYFLQHPETWTWSTIVWNANNDTNVSELMTNTINLVTNFPAKSRYIFLGPILSESPSSDDINFQTNAVAALASYLGTNFLDIFTVLCQGGTNIPLALRSDPIHLNTAGYGLVASCLMSNIAVWGSNTKNPANPLGVGAAFASPPPIGNITPNYARLTKIIVGDTNTLPNPAATPLPVIYPSATATVWKNPSTAQALRFVSPTYAGGDIIKVDYCSQVGGNDSNVVETFSTLGGSSGGIYTIATARTGTGVLSNAFKLDDSQNATFYGNIGTGGKLLAGSSSQWIQNQVFGTYSSPSLTHHNTNGVFALSFITSGANWETVFGSYGTGANAQWMQTRDTSSDSTTYPFVMNPLGGNVGIGLPAPTSTLHISGSLARSIAVGTAFTLTDTNDVYLCNVDGQTVTLETAVGHRGREHTVKLITPAATGTVATTSSQLIDGASTYSLSASNKFVRVIADGTNWWITGSN